MNNHRAKTWREIDGPKEHRIELVLSGGRVYVIDPGLIVMVNDLPGELFLDCEELGIYGYGRGYDDAMKALMSHFHAQYVQLVEEADERCLNERACELRRKLVERVIVVRK